MTKPLFKTEKEALMEIKRCVNSIELFEQSFFDSDAIVNPVVVHAIGRSFIQHAFSICEAVLYLICCKRLERFDVSEWPKIHELRKYCEQHNYIDCSEIAYEAADRMAKAKKSCDRKTDMTPYDLAKTFCEMEIFVEWLKQASNRSLKETVVCDDIGCIVVTDFLKDVIREWLEHYDRENRNYPKECNTDSNDPKLSFLDTKEINFDSLTEEEQDKYYRQRKGNKRESMAPLYIYLIIQKYSSREQRLHTKDIIHLLEKYYGISLGRNAVERILHTLDADGDINICRGPQKGSGYWYSEQNEEDRNSVDLDF